MPEKEESTELLEPKGGDTTTTAALDDFTALQDELDALNAAITKQGSVVRALKKSPDGVDASAIAQAVSALQALKLQATTLTATVQDHPINSNNTNSSNANKNKFHRKSFDDLVVRKMFVVPSFEIHGGVKGLFDLGPPACSLKVNTHNHHTTSTTG